MKIQALAALLAVLLCVGFCSCRRLEEAPELVTLLQGEGSPGGGTPTAWRSYSFPSYQMLEEALTGKDSSGFANLRAHQAELGAAYRNTLAAFEDGRIALAIPRMNGEPLALRNRFGFSNIAACRRTVRTPVDLVFLRCERSAAGCADFVFGAAGNGGF